MQSASLKLKTITGIREISPDEWNLLNDADDVFHTHSFLQNLEDAKVENSENYYLLIYDHEELVATAVVSSFIINLDIFIQAYRLVKTVRRIWPGWLKIKILMCGIPASLGQKNIIIKKGYAPEPVLKLVAGFMMDTAKKKKIKYLAFKEFKQSEIPAFESLTKEGYFRAFSLPYTYIDVKWKTFDEYVNGMRHGYKRQIAASLKKIGLSVKFESIPAKEKKYPDLQINSVSNCSPELFYHSYLDVMSRAESKLETFNLDFFKNYFSSGNENLIIIQLRDEKTIYGTAVLVAHEQKLTFALVGKNSAKDDYDTYFNLMIAIVKYSIENNFRVINMGQTGYYPKLRLGAQTENEYIYFKSRKPLMHRILKSLKNSVFPEVKMKPLQVFKDKNNGN